jgi:lysozyme
METTLKQQLMGEKLKLYTDTKNKVTIGIGHNIQDKGITVATSRFMCSEDIDEAENELNRCISWWKSKPDNVKLVLLNMMFNMGANKLMGFVKTLQLIKEDKFKEASVEMLNSAWANQVGKRAVRLSNMLKSCQI